MIAFIAILFIAILQAAEDVIQYHYSESIFRNRDNFSFWGKQSWTRKWKFGNPANGRRFFGSTTFLVWTTDGWHLVKFLYLLLVCATIAFNTTLTSYFDLPWWCRIIEAALLFAEYGGVFELFYKFIFRKR